MRSELVPLAVEYANMQSGNSNRKGDWMFHYTLAMERRAAQLLNGNGGECER
jgi:hypothetical protein